MYERVRKFFLKGHPSEKNGGMASFFKLVKKYDAGNAIAASTKRDDMWSDIQDDPDGLLLAFIRIQIEDQTPSEVWPKKGKRPEKKNKPRRRISKFKPLVNLDDDNTVDNTVDYASDHTVNMVRGALEEDDLNGVCRVRPTCAGYVLDFDGSQRGCKVQVRQAGARCHNHRHQQSVDA